MDAIIALTEKHIHLRRNELLKQEGTVDTHIYYVKEGSLGICIDDGNEEQIIRLGYKGNLIVAMDSFLTEQASPFYIQALKKTTIGVISKKRFTDFLKEHDQQRVLWSKILEELVLQQIEREKDLLVSSSRERYQRVLLRSPQLFQEIPHRYIANYLRMSPETLSRLKKS